MMKSEVIYTQFFESPVGQLVLGATDQGLCLLEFVDSCPLPTLSANLEKIFGCPVQPGKTKFLDQITEELEQYFQGNLKRFTTPLVMVGTAFQQSVWNQLLQIPYGQTATYAEIAAKISCPRAQRAVGRANGTNRIAIVIPCHRVVAAGGEQGGYSGGTWRKEFLLDLERQHAIETDRP